MQKIRRVFRNSFLVLAGVVGTIAFQAMNVMPLPIDIKENMHPLFQFNGWVYVFALAVLTTATILSDPDKGWFIFAPNESRKSNP